MSTSTTTKHASKKPASTEPHEAPAVAPVVAATPAAAPTAAASLVSFPTPPALSSVLVPPAGYVAGANAQFRGVLPQQGEQTALDAAIKDLGRIPNYAIFVGAPPLALLVEMLTLAGQWTSVRNASYRWDQFAATQEGNIWTRARPMMDDFRDSFVQAQKADPTLAAQLPGLTTFLGVRSANALKSASTRRANLKAEANGERPDHGQVGKRRKRAAANAALAAADAKAAGAPAAPVASTAPVETTTTTAATTTNGTSHS